MMNPFFEATPRTVELDEHFQPLRQTVVNRQPKPEPRVFNTDALFADANVTFEVEAPKAVVPEEPVDVSTPPVTHAEPRPRRRLPRKVTLTPYPAAQDIVDLCEREAARVALLASEHEVIVQATASPLLEPEPVDVNDGDFWDKSTSLDSPVENADTPETSPEARPAAPGALVWEEVDEEPETAPDASPATPGAVVWEEVDEEPAPAPAPKKKAAARKAPVKKNAPAKRTSTVADEAWQEAFDNRKTDPATFRAVEKKREKKLAVRTTERDADWFYFLARYRFADRQQLATLTGSTPGAAYKRLNALEQAGLVRGVKALQGTRHLWTVTSDALALADIYHIAPSKAGIKPAVIGHEYGLASIGAALEQGQGDPLLEEGAPFFNRYTHNDQGDGIDGLLLGETIVTEYQVSSMGREWEMQGGRGAAMMQRDEVMQAWTPGARSPETKPENAGVFKLWNQNYGDHIPDMVVARNRSEDGMSQSIAIELELNPKKPADWQRILNGYREAIMGNHIHSVIYFTQRKPIAAAIKRIGAEVGIPADRLRVLKFNVPEGMGLLYGEVK